MVVAGKIFRLSDQILLPEIASKLDKFHVEEKYEEDDHDLQLLTEIVSLLPKENTLTGIYSHDYVIHVFHRGKMSPLPRTVEAMFSFTQQKDNVFLTVVEKKRMANFVANKLSEILFEKIGGIVEARIAPETLKDFHFKNPEDTKISFFDNVDIPNINKLSIYGPDLTNTQLFDDYAKHGDLWYVVARSKRTGYVVGITREASVTIFNLADRAKFVEYVNKEIYPLILSASK